MRTAPISIFRNSPWLLALLLTTPLVAQTPQTQVQIPVLAPTAPPPFATPQTEAKPPNWCGTPTGSLDMPRPDDHFMRQRLVYRIDLYEKANKPLRKGQSGAYDATQSAYAHTRGMIQALLAGYEAGVLRGMNPDSLHQAIPYAAFAEAVKRKCGPLPNNDFGYEPKADPLGSNLLDDIFPGSGIFDDDPFGELEPQPMAQGQPETPTQAGDLPEAAYVYLSQVLDVVEDRIFDKVRSSERFQTQYICLYYLDEANPAQEQRMVAIRYDAAAVAWLNQTMVTNRWNDAEPRSLLETLDLRKHNHFVVQVSGEEMISLPQSDYRTTAMTEFEHHLWEF